jgi:hypothetical protein
MRLKYTCLSPTAPERETTCSAAWDGQHVKDAVYRAVLTVQTWKQALPIRLSVRAQKKVSRG